MITPFFKLRQDDTTLTVEIRAPNANIRDTEIEFFDRSFYFSSTPYFLRLSLTGDVQQQADAATTKYDADTGTFTIEMLKKTKGEIFPRLDMLNELLKPQRQTAQKLIEEVVDEEDGDADENDEEEDAEVQAKQSLPVEEIETKEDDEKVREYGYGFAWLRHGVLGKFGDELGELFQFKNVDEIKIDERLSQVQKEDEKAFDSEYYFADLFDEPAELTEIKTYTIDEKLFELNDEDRLQMKDLKVKLPTLSQRTHEQISYSLIDLFFSYLFDLRINDWEHNAVSDLMIGKLAPSLTCMVRYENGKEALCTAIRRSLCYSLYRQFDLTQKVAQDLVKLLDKGRSAYLHCLLTLRKRFNNSGQEFVYLYNQLSIDSMCVWIQSVDDSVLDSLVTEIKDAVKNLKRADIAGLDLDYLESEAKMIQLKVDEGAYDSDDN